MAQFSSLEICSGGGGQALGLELAGFRHEGLIEAVAGQIFAALSAQRIFRVV